MSWLNRNILFRTAITPLVLLPIPLLAQALLDSYPPDQLEKLGEARYQAGNPELALPYFAKALEKDPARLPSLVAAARILESEFQRNQAVALYRRALAIDPQNLDALAGLSSSAPTWQERRSATRDLAAAAHGAQARLARLRLRELEALGDRPAFETADPSRPYYFQLEEPEHDVPPGMTFPILQVTAPDGSKLRLLIATAIDGIWLRKRAAKALGARILFSSAYPWFNEGDTLSGEFAIVDKLELGELTLRNCPAFVRNSSRSYMYGVDGIIGTRVFQDFQIELGNSAADFSLLPTSQEYPAAAAKYFVPLHHFGPFLLAPVRLNPEQSIHLALSSITSGVILQKGKVPAGIKEKDSDTTYPLTGWLCSAPRSQGRLPVKIAAGAVLWSGEATSCEMKDLNRAAGFQVPGILGYSFLGDYTLVLDYRRGRAAFIPQTARLPSRNPKPDSGEKWPNPFGQ